MDLKANQEKKTSETAVSQKANLQGMVFISNRPTPKSKNENDLVTDLLNYKRAPCSTKQKHCNFVGQT